MRGRMVMNHKISKIVLDMFLNILANTIPYFVLQIVIYPQIAEQVGDTRYGEILTIISFMSLFTVASGNALNNVRLLKQNVYEEEKEKGDFNLILLFLSIFCGVIVSIAGGIYDRDMDYIGYMFLAVIAVMNVAREYYCVEFRLRLNYVGTLINNIILIVGYFAGYLFCIYSNRWEAVYIAGLLFSMIYISKKTTLIYEGAKPTRYFKEIVRETGILGAASFLGKALIYMDRLLLFPVMGGAAVSIYYIATLFGKIISMGMTPVNSVMLSYFSKIKSLKKKQFYLTLVCTMVLAVAGYIVCTLLSKPVLGFLYPQMIEKVVPYISLASAVAMVNMVASVLDPIILRFCRIEWQVGISSINIGFYILLASVLARRYGLYGFLWSNLIVNIIKVIIMCCIYIGSSQIVKKNT